MASAKLSDYHIKKIIRAYVAGRSPSQAATSMAVSYATIRKLYDLIRQRLTILMYYQSAEDLVERMANLDYMKEYWNATEFREYIRDSLGSRRGLTNGGPANTWLHEAELAHRYISDSNPSYADREYAEVLKLIRLSGPLNRKPTLQDMIRAMTYVADRIDDSQRMSGLRTRRWIEGTKPSRETE